MVEGRVLCPERQEHVDVERCLACPALRQLREGKDGTVVACAPGVARWRASAVVPA